VLLYSALTTLRKKPENIPVAVIDPLATKLKLNGSLPLAWGEERYSAQRIPLEFGIMFGAGTLSGLLGIGSGAVEVLAMDQAMKLPFKVSTTTSNFMIEVTAAASAGIHLSRGFLALGGPMLVMLGVLGGSLSGSHLLVEALVRMLKGVFSVVIVALGCELMFSGLTGTI